MDVFEDLAPGFLRVLYLALLSSCLQLDVSIIYLAFWENGWPDESFSSFNPCWEFTYTVFSPIKLTPQDHS